MNKYYGVMMNAIYENEHGMAQAIVFTRLQGELDTSGGYETCLTEDWVKPEDFYAAHFMS